MLNKKETAGETAMKVYTFNQFDHELRVAEINGEPWFVAKDVCAALGIKWSGKANTLAQIPEYWIGVSNFETPGGSQDLTVISEAGLYKLAFRCQSSEIADAFTNKVASEILPSIRKTGRYDAAVVHQRTEQAVAVRRGPRRATAAELMTVELMNLLWLIDESLFLGDRKAVAMELGVSRVTVNNVLRGRVRNARVLMALYQKAKENRACGLLYQRPELMSSRLTADESVDDETFMRRALPPVIYGNRKKGGQIGNQNARKHWGKESK